MPKELLHWWIASEGVRSIPMDCTVRGIIEEHEDSFLLGAALPDTLLYFLSGPYRKTALKLCENFHNPAGNSYLPLIRYAESATSTCLNITEGTTNQSCQQQLPPEIFSCLLGVASHMESDIVFHPFVYGLAGKDIGRHYRIETELDLWLLHGGRTPRTWRYGELLTEESTSTAETVIRALFDPLNSLPDDAITESVQNHARLQAIFSDPAWQLLARILGMIPGTPIRRWRWLFYPSEEWQKGKEVRWPSQWIHPVTGQQRGDTPDGLIADAVSRVAALLRKTEEEGIVGALKKQPGENLLSGLQLTVFQN